MRHVSWRHSRLGDVADFCGIGFEDGKDSSEKSLFQQTWLPASRCDRIAKNCGTVSGSASAVVNPVNSNCPTRGGVPMDPRGTKAPIRPSAQDLPLASRRRYQHADDVGLRGMGFGSEEPHLGRFFRGFTCSRARANTLRASADIVPVPHPSRLSTSAAGGRRAKDSE